MHRTVDLCLVVVCTCGLIVSVVFTWRDVFVVVYMLLVGFRLMLVPLDCWLCYDIIGLLCIANIVYTSLEGWVVCA